MKKQIVIYIAAIILIFFIGLKTTYARTINDGHSFILFSNYSKCERENDDGQDMGWDYLKLDTTDSGIPIVYVTEIPKRGSPAIHLICDGNFETVNVEKSAKLFDDKILRDNDFNNNSNNNSNNTSGNDNYTQDGYDGNNTTCGGLLGDPTKSNTVAHFLAQTLKFIQFCGPILVIVTTILDLIKATTSGDKDALQKMLKKTAQRIIYAVLLFVFPSILDIILKWTNIYGTCGILS